MIAGTRPAGFWRSTDAGATWSQLAAPGISQFSDVNVGPTRVTQILFDPVDDGTVWASVEIGSVYRSKDRGLTWERKENGLVSGDVHGLAVMKLREREQLKLDDRVGRYVANLHPAVAEATIAQLLSHSAGLTREGLR